MKRLLGLAAAILLSATACGGGGGESRTILVDYSHDEFPSFMLFNFPDKVTVNPGTTLVFRQTWTGEPHTVTGGKLVSEAVGKGANWIAFFEAFDGLLASGADLPDPEDPGDATASDLAAAIDEAEDEDKADELLEAWEALREQGFKLPDPDDPGDQPFSQLVEYVETESDKIFESGLPWALDESEEGEAFVSQNGGQPCYLTEGLPPKDPDKACADDEQRQPEFDGTHSYYNSGIIPFEGQQGNTYRVQLSDDIEPGTYSFYCAVHGFGQKTDVVVKQGEVPSQADVNREARREIERLGEPMEALFEEASSKGSIEIEGETVEGPFAGVSSRELDHAAINAFVPKKITVAAGEPITWKMMGSDHTISFDVPKYFPVVEFLKDGTRRLNPKLSPPAGGAPERPEHEGEGIEEIDGGTYDGSGFWSSGLIGAEPYLEYTLRISEPGTYQYACLLHPPMVGTVEVTPS